MKTIIQPTEATPRIEYHADLIAIHVSESEVVLIDASAFDDGPLSAMPRFVHARDALLLGIIEESEVEAFHKQQVRRQAEWSLADSEQRLAGLRASIEHQRAALEVME